MIKREWGAESNAKLPHLFIPSKTATLGREFAVEDLPLCRTAALVPGFAVKNLPLGKTLDNDDDNSNKGKVNAITDHQGHRGGCGRNNLLRPFHSHCYRKK